MEIREFFSQFDARIAKYDLLCHPFYQAWTEGKLTHDDLRDYAEQYYLHIEAFPTYLAELGIRLEDGELRRAVLANLADEKGMDTPGERPHSDLWLDFVEGMGGRPSLGHRPLHEVKQLLAFFHRVSSEGAPAEALAAFYAYESQVPRIAKEKDRGLKEVYGADEKTRGYFRLHITADVHHSQVWRQQLDKELQSHPEMAEPALAAAENAAQALWRALDAIDARRAAKAA